jgi:thioredoxin 1
MVLTDKNFKEEVIESKIPVLVEFWASWCPPCKMMEPLMKKLTGKLDGEVKICKLNVDQNKISAGEYEVRGVPTFISFLDGEEVDRKIGALSEGMLMGMIDSIKDKKA